MRPASHPVRIVPDPSDATKDFYITSEHAKGLWLAGNLWVVTVYQGEIAYSGNAEMMAKARRSRHPYRKP